jgi:hypothetical protein
MGDSISKRVRLPARMDGKRFWNEAQKLRSNPNLTVEVWMMLGQGSRLNFATNSKLHKQYIAYQLQARLDAASQIGAAPRIFCQP